MAPETPTLRRKIDELPRKPGVYLMKSARNEVIYVGKAKNLRARVRSYFQEGGEDWRLICKKIDEVADVDAVVTRSEKEALLLENNFIKQFRPRYNVYFRDDKSFVSIKIDRTEPWPRPTITRNLDDTDADYFGPYASAKSARRALRTIQDVFPLRRCSLRECSLRTRPCIYGEMDKCSGPCCGNITEEEYGQIVEQVTMLLRGKGDDLVARLREQMENAAAKLRYERAAKLRDRIRAVQQTLEKQHVASSDDEVDRDVFGICEMEGNVSVAALFVRDGNVRDVATYRFPSDLDSVEAIFGSFLNQFYRSNRFVPREVLVPVPTQDKELLEAWLSEKKGRKVRVINPKRGAKKRLTELANGNARQAEQAASTEEERRRLEMESLQSILELEELPRHVECFDISTTQGREAVGSMVVFRDGEADKASYRHYRIREVAGQDDFAMMAEVVRRRYSKLADPEADSKLPDLIVVDGGKGQLGAALRALAAVGVEGADVAALAKARSTGGTQTKEERVFLPDESDPVTVPENSYGFRLITRIRDEAHRFAVSYHRKLRRKSTMESPLTEVKGIGRRTAQRLMDHFGGLNKVKRASREELKAVTGISDTLADALYRHWRGADNGE